MWSNEIYQKALYFAARLHDNQKIPETNMSYVTHICHVATVSLSFVIGNNKLDTDFTIQCALLHDTIEDTKAQYSDIENDFGKRVADGVLALTKDYSLPKEKQMADSINRIMLQPLEIWIIKIADRITNLYPPPPSWNKDRINNYYLESIFINEKLSPASIPASEQLYSKINEYKKYLTRQS